MQIPDNVLKNICKLGQEDKCCRYILSSSVYGFECGKHTALKDTIDKNVDKMTAKGDNCEGLKME